jgi:hypothetical protein
VRLDPDTAKTWSDEEVVRRWGKLFPPRDKSREHLPVTSAWVQWRLQDPQWVATARQRLQSLSWFMKCLKEPLARLANRQDNARGAFFEQRFKSIAILDEEALLATCAYIDLNPVAEKQFLIQDRLVPQQPALLAVNTPKAATVAMIVRTLNRTRGILWASPLDVDRAAGQSSSVLFRRDVARSFWREPLYRETIV